MNDKFMADYMTKRALVSDLPLINQVMANPVMVEVAQQVVNFARLRAADARALEANPDGDGIDNENYVIIRDNLWDILTNSTFLDSLPVNDDCVSFK